MPLGRRPVTLVTHPESCECCGSPVAVTRRNDDGATRLSNVNADGEVMPGPHDSDDCHMRRGR
jgi:hypothetical protein